MQIPQDLLDSMYKKTGINKNQLFYALNVMGTKNLKTKQQKEMWSPERPTTQYCYVIAEWLYYFVAPKLTVPYKIRVPGDPGLHRFLKWPDGTIVDLAVDQFDNYEDIDYSKARVCYFLQTGCKGPSKRAKLLADIYRNKIG